MSFTDRDLREALAPLAGDAAALAAKVLAALPPPPAPARPTPRGLPWWLLLAGIAAGFALGFLLGQSAGLAKRPPEKSPPSEQKRPQKQVPQEPGIEVLAAVGHTVGYGTKKETIAFEAGVKAPLGLWLESDPDAQTALRIGEGLEIHVGPGSAVHLESEQHIACKGGRFWVDVHRQAPLTIDLGHDAQIFTSDAELLFMTGSDGPRVAVLRGSVELAQGKGNGAKVEQGQECEVNVKGIMAARPTEPKSLLVLGSWQAELLRRLRRR